MRTDWDQRYVDADTPWDSGEPALQLKEVVAKKGLIKPCRTLELGCGTGTNAIFLAQMGFDVTAVDISITALRKAREKADQAKLKINFIEADITASGFQTTLAKNVEPSGYYLVLAGNANA